MSADSKRKGRELAHMMVAVNNRQENARPKPVKPPPKAKPIDLSPLLEETNKTLSSLIEALPDHGEHLDSIGAALKAIHEKKDVDLKPLIEAISKIDAKVDTKPIVAAIKAVSEGELDLSGIEEQLKGIAEAMAENNKQLAQLVKVASASKQVVYDDKGRITEVKVVMS